MEIAEALEHARALVRQAQDESAKQAYLDVLRHDPTNFAALNELGTLALAGGFRSAARTAYLQAVQHHPGNQVARVNLANVLREDNDLSGARLHYQAALAIDPDLHEAHQGMAWVLKELHLDGAEEHWRRGFSGHALVTKPYRGSGIGVPLLLLVSARGGNIPTQLWLDDRRFTINAIYAEFYDLESPLPPHALVMNAVGDADLCDVALTRAEELLAHGAAPVINRPQRVRATGRVENARRLASIPGVIAPRIVAWSRAALLAADDLCFPLLLRSPGFHTGRHFVSVANRGELPEAVASLAGEQVLAIEYLDARGADGLARKYRVMFIDGVAYPLHLALSADWKVHYFTADMARDASYREEERLFLEDMPAMLGARAMAALGQICAALGLEYAGIDFALASDGSVLLFEANATMVVFPPGPDPMWDYRRPAINVVLEAATRMLLKYADQGR
jgi:glutathione synthase/RimK-type ligase-like ATP-grasp enzyme